MDSLKNADTKILQLKEQLAHLSKEQHSRGRILSILIKERNKLLHDIPQEAVPYPEDGSLPHYHYILPLVKEIYLLELKLKEQHKEYDKRKLQCEAARLGHAVLADTFSEEEYILKRWSRELRELSKKADSAEKTGSVSCSVTNITYQATIDKQVIMEDLGFTVLCQGVHVKVLTKSQRTCSNIHLSLIPSSAKIRVNSDTFVPRLEESTVAAISLGHPVSEIVSLVSQYIQEEMAPYVIIIPMKKKAGKCKTKSKSSSSNKDSVQCTDSEIAQ